ncbi:MAG TPA: hypothetical protein VFH54_16650 [Mycobacteriales bacterium]|nr:hypothetical protein [Mycobacteriales bacterium]
MAETQGRTVGVQPLLWAMIGWLVVMQIAVVRSVFPPIGLIQVAFLAVPAVLLARGWRHAHVLAAVFAGVVLLAGVPFLIKDLSEPRDVVKFAWNVVCAPLLVGLFVASIGAARAARRTAR